MSISRWCPAVASPHVTLQNLFKLDRFAHWSALEVYHHKSKALNVAAEWGGISSPHFPFQWATPYLPYLAVKLTSSPVHLYCTNYLPMFSRFTSLMASWHPLCVSWLGCITAVKMTLLPKILYLFRVLPISIPSYFWALQRHVHEFIWGSTKPRSPGLFSKEVDFREVWVYLISLNITKQPNWYYIMLLRNYLYGWDWRL